MRAGENGCRLLLEGEPAGCVPRVRALERNARHLRMPMRLAGLPCHLPLGPRHVTPALHTVLGGPCCDAVSDPADVAGCAGHAARAMPGGPCCASSCGACLVSHVRPRGVLQAVGPSELSSSAPQPPQSVLVRWLRDRKLIQRFWMTTGHTHCMQKSNPSGLLALNMRYSRPFIPGGFPSFHSG